MVSIPLVGRLPVHLTEAWLTPLTSQPKVAEVMVVRPVFWTTTLGFKVSPTAVPT